MKLAVLERQHAPCKSQRVLIVPAGFDAFEMQRAVLVAKSEPVFQVTRFRVRTARTKLSPVSNGWKAAFGQAQIWPNDKLAESQGLLVRGTLRLQMTVTNPFATQVHSKPLQINCQSL